MKNYIILVFKNIKRKKLRSWLTLIGIFIGISAVVSLISLGSTLQETVFSQLNLGSVDIINVQAGGINWAGPPGSAVLNHLTEEDAKAIERIGSVEYAIGKNIASLRAEFKGISSVFGATSLPDDRRINDVYDEMGISIKSGRFLREGERQGVLIGSRVADGKRNGLERDLLVGQRILLNEEEFRIVGILEREGKFTIDNVVLMNERKLREITGTDNRVDIISVKVRELDLIDFTKQEIEKLMRQRRKVKIGEEDFEVSTYENALASINNILSGVKIFILVIASISLIVGSFGIANTMFSSVLERRREIGIMKSIGAKNKDIFYQFFIEAGILGLVGGILGIFFGILIGFAGVFALNNFVGSNSALSLNWVLMFFVVLGSFLIGALSGIFPAMRAAKENPVEAMRE